MSIRGMRRKIASSLRALVTLVLLCAFAAPGAWAQSSRATPTPANLGKSASYAPAKAGPSQVDLLKDPAYQECGQSCMYSKANEQLSLQAVYLIKQAKLAKVTNDGRMGRDIVGRDFCLAAEAWGSCQSRFIQTQVAALRKIRAAMIANSESAAGLLSDSPVQGVQKRRGEQVVLLDRGDAPKRPQVTFVTTENDVTKNHQEETRKLQGLASNSYQESEALVQGEPSPDDYVVFKEYPKDPNNPAAGKIYVAERESSGELKIDRAAYKKAKENYDRGKGGLKKTLQAQYAQAKSRRTGKYQDDVTDLEKELFKESRMALVEAAEKSVNGSSGGAKRTPTAASSGTQKKGPGAGTNEVQIGDGSRTFPAAKLGTPQDDRGHRNVQAPDAKPGMRSETYTVILSPKAIDSEITGLLTP